MASGSSIDFLQLVEQVIIELNKFNLMKIVS